MSFVIVERRYLHLKKNKKQKPHTNFAQGIRKPIPTPHYKCPVLSSVYFQIPIPDHLLPSPKKAEEHGKEGEAISEHLCSLRHQEGKTCIEHLLQVWDVANFLRPQPPNHDMETD